MLEPLLLTVAVITIPFGLYLAFERDEDHKVVRRITRHSQIRATLDRLRLAEPYWDVSQLRFDTRQLYRSIQKSKQQADWKGLSQQVAAALLEDWRQQFHVRQANGVSWRLESLEILDVQPVNLQNRSGHHRDFVTMEIESRAREYLAPLAAGETGYYREGSGFVAESPEQLPLEVRREYWTFLRRQDGWILVRCDRTFPESLAFINEGG